MASWFPAGFPFQSSEPLLSAQVGVGQKLTAVNLNGDQEVFRLYASVEINIHVDICNYI